ncbi:hypothetical protein NEOLEDRAFT_596991 [Neolentinus lepideus HHB14362 ss-1]|uniref:Uncharacterized protein n=1 Tax=Neolentinus lepideus HHB14362 ss-1 TaxID=1314782 RepID=A0A165VAG9_9AGAM|nr:hypothetical protein NEOLEDRAFT_596991 [Neolentinus lepideus HHB14362 ss-1]
MQITAFRRRTYSIESLTEAVAVQRVTAHRDEILKRPSPHLRCRLVRRLTQPCVTCCSKRDIERAMVIIRDTVSPTHRPEHHLIRRGSIFSLSSSTHSLYVRSCQPIKYTLRCRNAKYAIKPNTASDVSRKRILGRGASEGGSLGRGVARALGVRMSESS